MTEAKNDAVQRAVAAWTADLGQNRQQHRAERPDSEDAERLPHGQVAEATELAERVLVTLQQVQRSPATEPTEYTGTDDGAHVSVQLGLGGLTGCTIDPRWAARYEGAAITAAVSAALVRAAAERAAATTQSGADLDGVLGDALATLSALTRQPTPESED
ncbi:hypothetical protein GCM10010172_28990 [Paractinoplanes ferrugineus]|uniref:YbaB/EbfC DNA-binding family protein n=1 Tax=Paractinoplanes ferrugineus TaxID=113564 RepID=A0A919M6C8_9ACTN|nr:hypothetical protein [Actinoplanes ferrugineus]GIE08191.1 hypothetical protein Afe05nite_00310 [Actinoplanes ferrugineus]